VPWSTPIEAFSLCLPVSAEIGKHRRKADAPRSGVGWPETTFSGRRFCVENFTF
jgi:hypothetical protein